MAPIPRITRGRHAKLVAFSGVDGAGKSTQIELLRQDMVAAGVPPRSFWARGGYTPTLNFIKSLARRLRPQSLPPPGPSKQRDRAFSSSRTRRLWLLLAISDLVLWYVVLLRLRLLLGTTVICDRYLDDTRLDFTRNFPSENFQTWWSWRLLSKLSPKPEIHFLLLVSPSESLRRSALKQEPFPDSLATLEWRHAAYVAMAAEHSVLVIDCAQPIAAVHSIIKEHVLPCG